MRIVVGSDHAGFALKQDDRGLASRKRATRWSTWAPTRPTPGRLPRLRRGGRARGGRRHGRTRRADLRQRRRRLGGRQQDPGIRAGHLPRRLLRPPGRRARRHERPGPGRAHHRDAHWRANWCRRSWARASPTRSGTCAASRKSRRSRSAIAERDRNERRHDHLRGATRWPSCSRYGQSVWLDYIRREPHPSGELQRLVDEDGLSGVTSNPAIFEKAIAGSADYDARHRRARRATGRSRAKERLRGARRRGHPGRRRRPAPGLRRARRPRDGYVSLEVSPDLAHDTAGHARPRRAGCGGASAAPNLMIKVPATAGGHPGDRAR